MFRILPLCAFCLCALSVSMYCSEALSSFRTHVILRRKFQWSGWRNIRTMWNSEVFVCTRSTRKLTFHSSSQHAVKTLDRCGKLGIKFLQLKKMPSQLSCLKTLHQSLKSEMKENVPFWSGGSFTVISFNRIGWKEKYEVIECWQP
jgi:hypothetical protein